MLQLTQDLFNRNALGKVARFIHIQAFVYTYIVTQRLVAKCGSVLGTYTVKLAVSSML